MLINMAVDTPVALFFFAHQDDEFGVFQQIVDEIKNGRRVCCIYLTDGGTSKATPEQRNLESITVLKRLGVTEHDIFFAGGFLSIPDACLPAHFDIAARWLREWLTGIPKLTAIYVPAWEGGHHDHDALHALVVKLAAETGLLHLTRQFPLYNGFECSGPLFRVFKPIRSNGFTESRRIPLTNRLRFLKYCLSYPSQAKTWLGLFPFVLFHYIAKGTQVLQPVSVGRLKHRPHEGSLYYERRKFFTWQQMENHLATWLSRETPSLEKKRSES